MRCCNARRWGREYRCATYNLLLTAYYLLLTDDYLLRTTYNLRLTAYDLLPTTYFIVTLDGGSGSVAVQSKNLIEVKSRL